jgi:hypothetical protein
MKYCLIIAGLFPILAKSQDCKVFRETDPYTKETKLSSGFINLQSGTVSIDADSKEIDFYFVVSGKCFDDASNVFIYFEGNKSKTTIRNAGSMNCEGDFHFKFRNGAVTPTVLGKLASQPVAQFIFTGNDKKQVTVSLLPEQQKIFMDAVVCITTQGKTIAK